MGSASAGAEGERGGTRERRWKGCNRQRRCSVNSHWHNSALCFLSAQPLCSFVSPSKPSVSVHRCVVVVVVVVVAAPSLEVRPPPSRIVATDNPYA